MPTSGAGRPTAPLARRLYATGCDVPLSRLTPERADRGGREADRGYWALVTKSSFAAAAALVAVLPAPASAPGAGAPQQVWDEHGDPLLVGSPVPDGSKGKVSWRVCPRARRCKPVASKDPY